MYKHRCKNEICKVCVQRKKDHARYLKNKVRILEVNRRHRDLMRSKRDLESSWVNYLIKYDFPSFLRCVERGIPVVNLMPEDWKRG
jgi:hypothetical protein